MSSKRPSLAIDRGNGKYYARVTVSGKRQRFTFTNNRKESEKQLTQLLHDLAAKTAEAVQTAAPPVPAAELTAPAAPRAMPVAVPVSVPDPCNGVRLGELIQRHLKWVGDNRAPGTRENRAIYLHGFLEFVGDVKVSEINRWTLENFYSWARENHSAGPNGGNQYLRNVKTMFLWGEEVEFCPCPVKKFPKMHETLPETKRFTDEELTKLLSRMTDLDFRDMVVFGLLTGLRPQELRGLQKGHVMRDGGGAFYLYIQKHKTARMAREPKPRSVPLVPEAVEIYERQIKVHPDTSHLFVNGDGEPYKAGSFRQRLHRWCKRAGIKPRSPYALRHTFGSLEAEANVNQAVIGQVMGHTQLRTTTRYIANNYEHHKSAVGAISGRIVSALKGDDA